MSAALEDRRALVAREVAALRRHGWPAGRALKLVSERIPPGADRDALGAMAAALESGRVPEAQQEPFLAVLAQGDKAGPEALLDVARADEAEREFRRAWKQAVVLPAVLLCIALASLLYADLPQEALASSFGRELPPATVLAHAVMAGARWLAPFLMVAVLLAAWKLPRHRVPGMRSLHLASLLRRYLAATSAGLSERQALAAVDPVATSLQGSAALRLDRYERATLQSIADPLEGARVLADELDARAWRTLQRARTWGPTLGIVVAIAFVLGLSLLVMATYLPIFSLAGSIS